MPLARRYAFVLGAVMVGLLLSPTGATAGQTPTVTFTGGCGTAGTRVGSEPDTRSLAVPVEGLVVFVNHLKQSATLLVNGRAEGTLRPNEQVSVVFHRGPVTVRLAPACLLPDQAGPVEVVVGSPATVGSSPRVHASARAALAQPVSPSASPAPAAPRRRASRLLVLVAVVCVVGVSVATIRAIIAQRAIRTASA